MLFSILDRGAQLDLQTGRTLKKRGIIASLKDVASPQIQKEKFTPSGSIHASLETNISLFAIIFVQLIS